MAAPAVRPITHLRAVRNVGKHRVFFGLGANLGDPPARLRDAVGRLDPIAPVRAVSSVYRTDPVGFRDQPEFFNLVVESRTALEPEALMAAVLDVERRLGRERSFPNGPRVIDIDLLAYDDRVLQAESLILPHPRLHLRGFVLVPLAEIAPEWRHPRLGRTAADLLAAAGPLERVERWGPLPP